MDSCQDDSNATNIEVELGSAIMDWTAMFVRLWMHDINAFTRNAGLSFGQMNLMLHIHYRGPCDVTSVAELLQMTAPGASQMVERMVQQGLVDRCDVPNDRRVRLVHLTKPGQDLVDESLHVHEKWMRELAQSLTPEESEGAAGILRLLTEKAAQKSW